ncbi:MAG: DUF1360 domain-containing protein [Planctomycetaceae bacterium]|nr:DUF1360 domain-containing protein [Planctomycetaceae bacterium]
MDYVILALATYRISNLLADPNEIGPLAILEKMRLAVGVTFNERGEQVAHNNFAHGLICLWCNSLWIGIILTIVYMWFDKVAVFVCLPLALSAVTMILARWVNG